MCPHTPSGCRCLTPCSRLLPACCPGRCWLTSSRFCALLPLSAARPNAASQVCLCNRLDRLWVQVHVFAQLLPLKEVLLSTWTSLFSFLIWFICNFLFRKCWHAIYIYWVTVESWFAASQPVFFDFECLYCALACLQCLSKTMICFHIDLSGHSSQSMWSSTNPVKDPCFRRTPAQEERGCPFVIFSPDLCSLLVL